MTLFWIIAACFGLGATILVTGRTARKDYHEIRTQLLLERARFRVGWYDFASNEFWDIGLLTGHITAGFVSYLASVPYPAVALGAVGSSAAMAMFQAVRWASLSRVTYRKKEEPPQLAAGPKPGLLPQDTVAAGADPTPAQGPDGVLRKVAEILLGVPQVTFAFA